MVIRTTKDQKPNFDLPGLPPLSQRDRQILQVTEKQNQSLAKVQEHSKKNLQFQPQFQHHATANVFWFRPQASRALSKKPRTE